MRNILIKLGVSLVGLLLFTTAQALPISGQVQISSNGQFVDAAGNQATDDSVATGVDFATGQGNIWPGNSTPLGLPTGDIFNMIAAANPTFPGSPILVDLFSFNLANIPPAALEWSISPVQLASGGMGVLNYTITGGQAIDVDHDQNFDLAGTGYFSVTCTTTCDATVDAMDQTPGKWDISGNGLGNTSVVLSNVPAPATIGILGIALLGLGLYRRRKAVV